MATQKVKIDYVKSDFHSTGTITGAYGGLSPSGKNLVMNLYFDRPAFPESVEYEIDQSTNTVLRENNARGNDGEREVLFTAVLNEETVQILKDWFEAKLIEFKNLDQNTILIKK